ncbi:hypothetical protein SDC9_196223 [bioreactor metagenome]|uniref:Uncharacterized protein n=1 Tax=bioreactor metagenome TaxID=1076179 RepID=A0A645IMZ1_9ZZZZ
MAHDSHLEVVDHDFLRNRAEKLQGMAVAGQELIHGFREGELHIDHTAVTKDHDKEGEPAAGRTHRH